MFRDLFFVLVVLCVSVYAHTNKDMIIDFIEVLEVEREPAWFLEGD